MIYAIIFGAFALAVLIYACNTFLWLHSQMDNSWMNSYTAAPMVIEKAYRAMDFRTVFEYTERIPERFDHFEMQNVIRNKEHLDYTIEKFTGQLVQEMLKEGVVEMKEQEDIYRPYIKRLELKVKVYKPEL